MSAIEVRGLDHICENGTRFSEGVTFFQNESPSMVDVINVDRPAGQNVLDFLKDVAELGEPYFELMVSQLFGWKGQSVRYQFV